MLTAGARRFAVVVIALAAPAQAAEAPSLPASAKKLSAAEIVALYDRHAFAFTTWTAFGVATGTVTYDFRTGTSSGTYRMGSFSGSIDGRIHMQGDRFCYKVKMDREHCNFVYRDGSDIYDVEPGGTVASINRRQ